MSYDRQANLFRVLMHPTRLAILDLLRNGEECVCHLEAVLHQRQAYMSQQLMVLREVGLVLDRREGNRAYYCVADPGIFRVLEAARVFAGETVVPVSRPDGCDCPKCSAVAGEGNRSFVLAPVASLE
jgi:ArsR family transcriptional regulator